MKHEASAPGQIEPARSLNELQAELHARIGNPTGEFVLDARFCMPLTGITALRGNSGAGKSTLLRFLTGLQRADSGSTLFFGQQCWQSPTKFVAPQQRRLGVVFQQSQLFPHLNVLDNLRYAHRHRHLKKANSKLSVDHISNSFDLQTLLTRRPSQLSGGQQRRVAIARALLNEPAMLLLDEPLSGLDHTAKATIIRLIQNFVGERRIPVLWISHDITEVGAVADYLLLMEKGRIISSGPLLGLFADLDSPLVDAGETGAILRGRVSDFDRQYQLAAIDIGEHRLWLHQPDLQMGSAVRIRIPARDVSLSLNPPQQSSILNCFTGQIEGLRILSPSETLVRIDIGGQFLLACITGKSSELLNLQPGLHVYSQVKASALVQTRNPL